MPGLWTEVYPAEWGGMMTPRQKAIIRDLSRCTFLPGSFEKRFVRDMATKPDDYELSEKQAAFLDKTHHRYREQIMNHWQAGREVWNEPEDDPDDIEGNRLAYEALYPEERDRDCPICGRWRNQQYVTSEGVTWRCASCDDQIYTDDETDEFEEDD